MRFSAAEVRAMAEGDFFGVGNAQLPSDPMRMVDRIDCLDKHGGEFQRGYLRAGLNIRPDHWFFQCHFRNDPVMPGCLGLDALWQLLGVFLASRGLPGRGRAIGVGELRFSGQIYPDAGHIDYELHIKRVFERPMPLAIADGLVIHNKQVIYRAKDLRVGLVKGEAA